MELNDQFLGCVALAPMSGVTDLPMRRLAWRLGADQVTAEMVASAELVGKSRQSLLRAAGAQDAGPLAIQLAGREAHWMAEGARAAADLGAQAIDINMGCPARKVVGGLSGSALMRDLDHATRLIEATVHASPVPVTLKMRLGWDEHSINAPELARRAEQAGVVGLTVHGRTRCQFYEGKADWRRVRAVVGAVRLPVTINGDITCARTARAALAESGARNVMIGRGAYGRPWLPALVKAELKGAGARPLSWQARMDVVREHYDDMLRFYGAELGMKIARKHIGWYAEELGLGKAFSARVNRMESHGEVASLLASVAAPPEGRAAA